MRCGKPRGLRRDNRLLPAGVRPGFFLFETVEEELLLVPPAHSDSPIRSAAILRNQL